MITDKNGNILKEPYLSMAKDPILNGKFTFCSDSTDLKERFTFKRTDEGKIFWRKVYDGKSPFIDIKMMANYNHVFGKENKEINEYLSKCFSKESGEFSFHGNFLQVKSIAFTISNYVNDNTFIEFPKTFDDLRSASHRYLKPKGYYNNFNDRVYKIISMYLSSTSDIVKDWELKSNHGYYGEGFGQNSKDILGHFKNELYKENTLLRNLYYTLKVSFYKQNGEIIINFDIKPYYNGKYDNSDNKIVSYNSTPFTTFFKIRYNSENYYGNPLSGFYNYKTFEKLDTTVLLNSNYNISYIENFKLGKKVGIEFLSIENFYIVKDNRGDGRSKRKCFLVIDKRNGLSIKSWRNLSRVPDEIIDSGDYTDIYYHKRNFENKGVKVLELKSKKSKIVKEEDKWNILLNPSLIKELMKYKLPSLVK